MAQTPADDDHHHADGEKHGEELPQCQRVLRMQHGDAGAQEPAGEHEPSLHDHARAIAVTVRHQLHQNLVGRGDDGVENYIVEQVDNEDDGHRWQRQAALEDSGQQQCDGNVRRTHPEVDVGDAEPSQ